MIIFFVVLVLALLLLQTSLLVVPSHQYAVFYRSNKIQRVVTEPGMYFKLPFSLQKVRILDKRVLTAEGKTEIITVDNNKLKAIWYVQWQIDQPTLYANKFGYRDTIVTKTLHEIIQNSLQNIVKQEREAALLSQPFDTIDNGLEQYVQNTADQQKLGLQIKTINLVRLNVSSAKFQQAQTDMVQFIKNSQQQLQANMQQELAQLEETAAQGSSQVIELARQEAARIKAEGDIEAMSIYAKDYAQNPKLAKYLQTVSLYKNTFNKKQDMLVLDPDKEGLFSQLQRRGSKLKAVPKVTENGR